MKGSCYLTLGRDSNIWRLTDGHDVYVICKSNGLLNSFLAFLGLPTYSWLGDPSVALNSNYADEYLVNCTLIYGHLFGSSTRYPRNTL